jgi:hypothetical protein
MLSGEFMNTEPGVAMAVSLSGVLGTGVSGDACGVLASGEGRQAGPAHCDDFRLQREGRLQTGLQVKNLPHMAGEGGDVF